MKLTLNRSETIEKLAIRDGLKCAWLNCEYEINNSNILTIEHVKTRSSGGTDDLWNLELLCMKHNYHRADREYISYELRILEPINKKVKPPKIKRNKPSQCCNQGRDLAENEVCSTCGSEPQPQPFPRFLKRELKDCDHATTFCWACALGFRERKHMLMV